MSHTFDATGLIFLLTLALTFCAAWLARIHARPERRDEDLAGRQLNKWLVGLSAATTGNSGFIVTGAVGLGYAGGVHWLFLPLSWMLGDFLFWSLFPSRLNRFGRDNGATTISEMLTSNLSGGVVRTISVLVSLVLIIFLSVYTSAQWLAGQKFLTGVFEFSDLVAVVIFACLIIVYTAVGGFRGSVYTDTLQSAIRIIGTLVALLAVGAHATGDQAAFSTNIANAGKDFLDAFPNGTAVSVIGFVLGFAAAAVGFGLGQPQIVSRYLAGSSPQETRAAWWIYIGFIQFTWIAMTCFGILLRGVMPGLDDPETGLSVFFQRYMGPVLTGIIVADVFATIASTSNGILVAITQTVQHDLLSASARERSVGRFKAAAITFIVGLLTILLSLVIPGNVFSIALVAASMTGSALAGPVMIKVLRWNHSGISLCFAIAAGIGSAVLWRALGLNTTLNEAAIGIPCSLLFNWLAVRFVR